MSGASSADSSGGGEEQSFAESAARKFTELWQAALAGEGARPSLSRFLARVPESQQLQLLEQLLPIELAARAQLGKPLDPSTLHGKLSPALLQRLEQLLAAPLELPTLAPRSPVPAGSRSRSGSASQQIGPYKLLQKLGEGGMGEVWMAEQERPVRRRVALKLIRAGLDNQQIIARFEAERQALSMMNHPNIAKVLDVGTTGDGLPYFVMELVAGIPFNKFCDEHKLSIRNRLKLFLPVCAAVQHAHQKGIIHRDLKPSNVLVCLEDGKPVPKVIDFGLAKALAHTAKLTDRTLFTEFGQVVGTLQYMSPEQAEMNQLDIDTRSDIYSLGVMLYELLTGSTPIDQATLRSQAILAVLATIREREPPRPSSRLSSVSQEAASGISAQRQIEPKRLKSLLEGELDWIVMKALEKERSRRYETANGFADDIGNYLRGDVVAARPPSTAYRLAKYVRRHRGLVAALTTIATLLVAGIIGTSLGLFRAEAARVEAESARRIADQKSEEIAQEKKKVESERAKTQAALEQAESTLARSNYFLAVSRWDESRPGEARELLTRIPAAYRNFEWRLATREFEGSQLTLNGHSQSVSGVAFSPDGTRIASASRDGTIKLWDAASGAELRTLSGHTSGVQSVVFNADGTRLASGSLDKTIKLWDANSGAELQAFNGHEQGIICLAISPDGSRLASGSGDGEIKLWNIAKGTALFTITGHTKVVVSVSFSPDGRQLASGSNDQTIRLWDVATGAELRTLTGHESWLTCMAISPDGRQIASGSTDKNVIIWDVASGAKLRTLKGHLADVFGVTFSPDGIQLASSSRDRTIKVWDIASGAELRTLRGHKEGVGDVAFSPDGTRLASASVDATIKIWDAASGSELDTLNGHDDWVGSLAFSPDGTRLASASGDKTIKLWDTANLVELRTYIGHDGEVLSVAFSPDGKRIASASHDQTIKIWDAANGSVIHTFKGHSQRVNSVTFSPDGTRLASTSWDNTVKLWDSSSGAELHTLVGHKDWVSSAAFSPDGKLLASVSRDGTIKLWELSNGTEQKTCLGHDSELRSIAFSPDGARFASGGTDRTIKIWDTAEGTEIGTLKGNTEPVFSLCFSPDGTRLASGSGAIKLWDWVSGEELRTLNGHAKGVASVVFSPNGMLLASASYDHSIRLWDGSIQRDESTFRRLFAAPKTRWHREQAAKSESNGNWYAATFHRAWALKGKPDSAADRSALEADYARLREQAADQAERLRHLLPADMAN